MGEFLSILIGIWLTLALAPAVKAKSWCRFFIALILSFFGVILPLFIFGFSSMMEPDWKGACKYGWLDCFIMGKLALTPLVLLATAALYALDILCVENRTARWIVIGIFLGAIVSSICFVFGMVCIGAKGDGFGRWLLVPLYVAVWYSARAVLLIKTARPDLKTYLISFAGSLPFWLASWLWSRSLYASLPNQSPDGCFIVTAAGRGHAAFVGRHIKIERNGRSLLANQQLITLWQFENLWRNFAPRSHQIFRCIYNRLGLLIAARIRSPWLADFTYLAIKPLEFIAKLANVMVTAKIERFLSKMSQKDEPQKNPGLHDFNI